MSTNLADLQASIQAAIQSGSDDACGLIRQPPSVDRRTRLAVYQEGYVLRLIEVIKADHPKLRSYMGEVTFRDAAQKYVRAHPSDRRNARWFARHMPEFLAASPRHRHFPELAELSSLERALNDAFDAADCAHATLADLGRVDAGAFAHAMFDIHPSVRRLKVTTNVTGLWSSLTCEEPPPKPYRLDAPQEIIVWRQGNAARFRLLGPEEAMAFDAASAGAPFGVICEMLAVMGPVDSAAISAATYLRGWIESETISRIRFPETCAPK